MGNDDYYDDDNVNSGLDHVPVKYLLVMALVAFYFQAVVTEERFVPALNIIAKRLKISDDVAGATLMAAGASAPELFSNIVSIFITHSALGMGTIVGSEIFNQLMICAGAIFSSKNNCLVLDPVILGRDISFYFIALLILYWALSDTRAVDYDDVNHVFISWYHGATFLGCYFAYVFFCANFNRWFRSPPKDQTDDKQISAPYEAFEISVSPSKDGGQQLDSNDISESMPFVREPVENFHDSQTSLCGSSMNLMKGSDQVLETTSSVLTELYSLEETPSNEKGCATMPSIFLLDQLAPSLTEIHGIHDIERKDDSLSLYLWQRSVFYDKAKLDINTWELRWFTFYPNKIISLPRRRAIVGDDDNMFIFPLITSFELDDNRLLIKIKTRSRDYIFLAPTEAIFAAATRRLEELLELPIIEMEYREASLELPIYHESLLHYPDEGSLLEKFFHIILFPVKTLIHFGIPDVRKTSVAPLSKAVITAIMSVLFLIGGSYVMVASLDSLAHELDLPESVVGATISAAGTSLPNYIASQIAARQGLGNMAISNVFGSNTFNILIALGLPWLLYTCIHGGHYSELRDEGITESILAMAVALFIFVFLITLSKCQLHIWHAYSFVAFYMAFIIHYISHCFV